MKKIEIGNEYWTWIKQPDRKDIPMVKKIVVKDIFTIMVTADVNGTGWSVDIPKEELYETQEEAVDALQKALDDKE